MNHRKRPTWRAMIPALMLIGAVDAMSRSPSPEEVTGNPDCKIKAAHELALLYWPSGEGSRFVVLDNTGTVFDGEVPFVPSRYATKMPLIKRADGRVLVALADLAYESSVYGEPDALAPVRVFLDGEMIYQTERAWQFDVASDGSSFFTIEPALDAEPSLRVQEIGSGAVRHIDLAEPFAAHGISKPTEYGGNVAEYSRTQDEVVILPAGARDDSGVGNEEGNYLYFPIRGRGTYLFYSLQHEQWRVLEGEGNTTFFRSSREAYFIGRCRYGHSIDGFAIPGSETVITKKEYLWDGRTEPEVIEAWSRSIDLDGYDGSFNRARFLGDDSLLELSSANTHVLDTSTGETIFAFPTTENLSRTTGPVASPWKAGDFISEVVRDVPVGRAYHELALARLKDVMPPDATIDDVVVISDFSVADGELTLNQFIRQGSSWDGRWVGYKFDMKDLHIDAKPTSRLEYPRRKWDDACSANVGPGKGLQVSGGRLVYLGRG